MKIVDMDGSYAFFEDGARASLQWKEGNPTHLPFFISAIEHKALKSDRLDIAFPFKTIYFDDTWNRYVAVRIDTQPLMWIWWWFAIRIEQSIKLTSTFLLYLLGIWGLNAVKRGAIAQWSDVWKYWRSRFGQAGKIAKQ